jgi:hypothetical protein
VGRVRCVCSHTPTHLLPHSLTPSLAQEVIGSAIALRLLTAGAMPLWAGCVVSAAASFALLLVERAGVRWLEGVFGALIAAMVRDVPV